MPPPLCLTGSRCTGHAGRSHGFTLIELMTVLALMAVLVALALPSFGSLIEKFRVESAVSAMSASLSDARAEAMRRGVTVRVQRNAACLDVADWGCGWSILVGTGKQVEVIKQLAPDTRVSVRRSHSLMGMGSIAFDAMGTTNVASFGFQPLGVKNSPNAMALCMARSGRVKLVRGGVGC